MTETTEEHEDQVVAQLTPEYVRALLTNTNVSPYDDAQHIAHCASLFARAAVRQGNWILDGHTQEATNAKAVRSPN